MTDYPNNRDYAVRMVRRAIEDAHNAPLRAGLPRARVDCALLERLCRLAEGKTGGQKRAAELEAELSREREGRQLAEANGEILHKAVSQEIMARRRAEAERDLSIKSAALHHRSMAEKLTELALWARNVKRRAERLEAALTPSAGTKYAYMGEFVMEGLGDGEKVMVPWATIKEIMKAIRSYADALALEQQETKR